MAKRNLLMSAKHTGVVSAGIGGIMSVPFETSLVEDLVGVAVGGLIFSGFSVVSAKK